MCHAHPITTTASIDSAPPTTACGHAQAAQARTLSKELWGQRGSGAAYMASAQLGMRMASGKDSRRGQPEPQLPVDMPVELSTLT